MSKKVSVNIVTLGCSKNLVDSEVLKKQLELNNIEVFHEAQFPTDIVIVNTCGFIGDAKEESINTILEFADQKKNGVIGKLIVSGCLSQRYKDELEKEIPEVDRYFGVEQLEDIVAEFKGKLSQDKLYQRSLSTPSHYAYLKIAEGCNRKCSFCAIPAIRGKFRSRSVADLVEEANSLALQGVKELILIAQDLTYFGKDTKESLPNLLKLLCKIDGIEWIRLHYTYPDLISDDLIEVISEESKICNYLDIPVQHISDTVLEKMRRGYDSATVIDVMARLRKAIPDIAVRTTVLIGHPGETKREYDKLLAFIKSARFDRLGAFSYSHEDGTYSYINFKDTVSDSEKTKRLDALMEVQQEISLDLNSAKIGKTFKTIIDKEDADFYYGRTQYDSPDVDNEVIISKREGNLKIGDFYTVRIDSVSDFDLFGSII